MSATQSTCENCDEPIHLDAGGGWIHELGSVPCLDYTIPVAEPVSVECEAEAYSWDYFSHNAVDPYWMRCDLTYPHDEHENQGTGAKWTDALSSRAGDA
jgi:hypothetical protein